MGWSAHKLPNEGWQLWTRGGTDGVYVQKKGEAEEIEIPSELLWLLVADEVRSRKISELEDMPDEQVLGLRNPE